MDHIKKEILGETMATYSDTYLNLNFKIGLSKPVWKTGFVTIPVLILICQFYNSICKTAGINVHV